jgi:hypothetical protein
LAISRNPQPEHAVAVFESNRCLNLESMHMSDPDSVQTTARITKLLGESADELIAGCVETLKGVQTWIGQLREGRLDFWVGKDEKKNRIDTKIKKYEEMKKMLEDILQRFRHDKRCGRDFKSTNHANTGIIALQAQDIGPIPACLRPAARRITI